MVASAQRALAGVGEAAAQRVQVLALVELAGDPPPVGLVCEGAGGVDGAPQRAVFLDRGGEGVLLALGGAQLAAVVAKNFPSLLSGKRIADPAARPPALSAGSGEPACRNPADPWFPLPRRSASAGRGHCAVRWYEAFLQKLPNVPLRGNRKVTVGVRCPVSYGSAAFGDIAETLSQRHDVTAWVAGTRHVPVLGRCRPSTRVRDPAAAGPFAPITVPAEGPAASHRRNSRQSGAPLHRAVRIGLAAYRS